MNGWENFFIAEAGASAALTGLIFVGVSINLDRVLSNVILPLRALVALIMLLTVLVISMVMLIPGQSTVFVGREVLGIGVLVLATSASFDTYGWRRSEAVHRKHAILSMLLNLATLAFYVVAGGVILEEGSPGIYFLVPATLLSILKALLDSWVLLIEINR